MEQVNGFIWPGGLILTAEFEIQINQAILVTRADSNDDWYVSKVQDLDDNNFCISIPTQGSSPLILNNRDAVKVSLIFKGARFEFETLILGRRYDNIQLYVLALPKEYKRIQLRDFVRLPIVLEMYYAELPEDGQLPVFVGCSCLDLSGGGIRLLLKKGYQIGTRLLLKFPLPFRNHSVDLEAMGKVVRSSLIVNINLYHVSVTFENISCRQQDLIVRFVLTRLSEQNRLR
jgi:c-di-GMP-binding flagellar brake protein YcgR